MPLWNSYDVTRIQSIWNLQAVKPIFGRLRTFYRLCHAWSLSPTYENLQAKYEKKNWEFLFFSPPPRYQVSKHDAKGKECSASAVSL